MGGITMNSDNRMKENLKYNAWLKAVKTNQPILNDPDGLMQSILSDIQITSVKSKFKKSWKIITSVSAVAAVFLLCLFISEVCLRPSSEVNASVSIEEFDDSALRKVFSTFSDESHNKEPLLKRKSSLIQRWQEQRNVQVQKKMQLLEKHNSNNSYCSNYLNNSKI